MRSKTLFLFLLLFLSFCFVPTRGHVVLFGNNTIKEILYTAETITTSCETFPYNIRNKAGFIETSDCINIYFEENCQGEYLPVDMGEHRRLPYFQHYAISFEACTDETEYEPSKDVRIKLYENRSMKGLMWNPPITPNCTSLPENMRKKISSMQADICVILFSETNCTGSRVQTQYEYFLAYADFDNKMQSFMPCNVADVNLPTTTTRKAPKIMEAGNLELNSPRVVPQKHLKIELFRNESYEDILFTTGRVTTSCQTLPPYIRHKTSSIKTSSCVNLYSSLYCEGNYFPLDAGDHPSLPFFKNQVDSYQACTDEAAKNDPWKDVRIELYAEKQDYLYNPLIIPGCVTLPEHVRNMASSMQTDVCVILFFETNCTGSRVKITKTETVDRLIMRTNLGKFKDKLQSFMPCNATDIYKPTPPPPSPPYTEGQNITNVPQQIDLAVEKNITAYIKRSNAKVAFFGKEAYQEILYTAERITPSCEILPPDVRKKASSIITDTCIKIYSDENCEESYFPVDAGKHPSIPYFDVEAVAFQACDDVGKDDPWKDVRIKLYEYNAYRGLMWNPQITPNCVTLPETMRKKVSSLRADICVILFSETHCIGSRIKTKEQRMSNVTDKDFNNFLKSFMPCNVSDVYKHKSTSETISVRQQSLLKVEFFKNENYQEILYTSERITTTCETLPPKLRKQASSVKTETCINLYSRAECLGKHFQLESGDHSSLLYFDDEVTSFQACTNISKDESWKDLRIKLYEHAYFEELIWTPSITPNCVTLPSDIIRAVSSLKTDICVTLFSEQDCVGSRFETKNMALWRLGNFDDNMASFMPCNLEDVYRYKLTPPNSSRTTLESMDKATIKMQTNYELVQNVTIPHKKFPAPTTSHSQNVLIAFLILLILFLFMGNIFFIFRKKINAGSFLPVRFVRSNLPVAKVENS